MPQIFQVLRCYKCSSFQVHQTKKSNKFECKLCGEKQLIKRHYAIGTAKECRLHVQKLNGIRGELEELKETREDSDHSIGNELEYKFNPKAYPKFRPKKSKWSDYVENPDSPEQESPETMFLNDTEVVLEVPKKQRKTKNFNCPAISLMENFGRQSKAINDALEDKRNVNQNMTNIVHCCNNINPQYNYNETNTMINMAKTPFLSSDITMKPNSTTERKTIKKFVPPIASNTNSKWAQFVGSDNQTGSPYYDNFDNDETNELRELKLIVVDNNKPLETNNPQTSNPKCIKYIGSNNTTQSIQQKKYKSLKIERTELTNESCQVQRKQYIREESGDINRNISMDIEYGHISCQPNPDFLKNEKQSNLSDGKETNGKNKNLTRTQKKALFSLCDDNELDSVLDIII